MVTVDVQTKQGAASGYRHPQSTLLHCSGAAPQHSVLLQLRQRHLRCMLLSSSKALLPKPMPADTHANKHAEDGANTKAGTSDTGTG